MVLKKQLDKLKKAMRYTGDLGKIVEKSEPLLSKQYYALLEETKNPIAKKIEFKKRAEIINGLLLSKYFRENKIKEMEQQKFLKKTDIERMAKKMGFKEVVFLPMDKSFITFKIEDGKGVIINSLIIGSLDKIKLKKELKRNI